MVAKEDKKLLAQYEVTTVPAVLVVKPASLVGEGDDEAAGGVQTVPFTGKMAFASLDFFLMDHALPKKGAGSAADDDSDENAGSKKKKTTDKKSKKGGADDNDAEEAASSKKKTADKTKKKASDKSDSESAKSKKKTADSDAGKTTKAQAGSKKTDTKAAPKGSIRIKGADLTKVRVSFGKVDHWQLTAGFFFYTNSLR